MNLKEILEENQKILDWVEKSDTEFLLEAFEGATLEEMQEFFIRYPEFLEE